LAHLTLVPTLLRFTLDCQAKGSPEPEYRWFKDGEELTEENLANGLAFSGDRNQVPKLRNVLRPKFTIFHNELEFLYLGGLSSLV
jgi:hypothetical protein